MSIKIEYSGCPDIKKDKLIIKALESNGFDWYASGYNFKENKRDICFDEPVNKK